ncbi:unnamed protein product [marine sediment metagenome]|uniref:HTH arsR-type domain-containing protein n=1 Tax=marine sediment metagenome TaxID=412755 RepID=X1MXQ2_9ZZZZ
MRKNKARMIHLRNIIRQLKDGKIVRVTELSRMIKLSTSSTYNYLRLLHDKGVVDFCYPPHPDRSGYAKHCFLVDEDSEFMLAEAWIES